MITCTPVPYKSGKIIRMTAATAIITCSARANNDRSRDTQNDRRKVKQSFNFSTAYNKLMKRFLPHLSCARGPCAPLFPNVFRFSCANDNSLMVSFAS